MNYIFFVLLLCCSGRSQSSDHGIAKYRFRVGYRRFFSQNLDFNALPENKVVNLTYWVADQKLKLTTMEKAYRLLAIITNLTACIKN